MKKAIILLILCSVFLIGCNKKDEIEPTETFIISGTIETKSHAYHTSNLVIQTNDGIKYPVYEIYSDFSKGLKEGDKVCFEVEKVDGSGYKIIGFGLENNK